MRRKSNENAGPAADQLAARRQDTGTRVFIYNRRMSFLLRLLLNAVAIMAAAWVVPGVSLAGPFPAVLAGALLGLVNALIRPVLVLLTFPFTVLTLGLFILVVNAICFGLTAALVPGFDLSGFGAALLGALVVSLVSWALNATLTKGNARR